MHLAQQVQTMSRQDIRAGSTRRKHDAAFKRELIERTFHPGASVSAIALEHGLNANLLFKWRRMQLRANSPGACELTRGNAPTMLPVMIQGATVGAITPAVSMPRPSPGVIEIDIGASRVRLRGAVDEANLRCVLQTLGAQR